MTDEQLDIRRPDLHGKRRGGTVRWFKDDNDGYRTTKPGQRHSFIWKGGVADHGRHAAENLGSEHPAS